MYASPDATVQRSRWPRQVRLPYGFTPAMIRKRRLNLIYADLQFRHQGNRPPLHLSFRPEAEGRSGEIRLRIRRVSTAQADVSATLDMTTGRVRRLVIMEIGRSCVCHFDRRPKSLP